METFSALLAICAGNSPVSGEFPAQRPVTRSFDVFFDVRVWVNTREAGHLRRYRIHYDVIVMIRLDCGAYWIHHHGDFADVFCDRRSLGEHMYTSISSPDETLALAYSPLIESVKTTSI